MVELQKSYFCEKCNKDIKIPKNILSKIENKKMNYEIAIQKTKEKHEHKSHALILGVKFKLYPSKEEAEKLKNYFYEYAKAVTFAARIIDKLRNPFKFAGKRNKDENTKKKWIFDKGICEFCGKESDIAYINKNRKKICNSCYLDEFGENGMRKKLYSAKGREVNPSYNILNSTNGLAKTHYNYAVRDAFQLLDAIKKQRAQRIRRLSKDKIRLRQFEEMLNTPDKRIELPLKDNQREKRYLHKSLENRKEEFRGYTLSQVRGKIKILTRNIKREEKSLKKKSPIIFKGKRIMISPSVKFDEKDFVRFTISKDLPKEYKFSGLNVHNKHGKEFFKEKIQQISKQKPKYAYILRKQVNKDKNNPLYDYYLQYTIESLPKIKTKYSGILGIDRGINHLACVVFLENNKSKPSLVKFYSGREILNLRNKRRKQLYFLRRKHNKRRKQKNLRFIEPIIDQVIHNVSKKIVELAREKGVAISLEQLEKPKKGRFKQSRKLKYKLSQFSFKRLSTFIDYKAKREGIKVVYIPPEMTSQTCSHCHSVDTRRPYKKPNAKKPSYALFKCNKCNIELNADYNAAFNIAQKGLKSLNS